MKGIFFAALALASTAVFAQSDYPSKPITIVVPYPPGGTTDIIPRALQPELSRRLGVPVVVENRPGAGGGIGTAAVARAQPDGYTVVIVNNQTMAINPWVYKQLAYEPLRDFVGIMNAGQSPNALVVNSKLPVSTLGELIALAKSKPGSLTYASSGSGSTSHLCGSMLSSLAQIQIEHVSYKGPAPAHQDLLAGHVSMMCDAISNLTGRIASGQIRGIVVAAPARHPAVPNLPSAVEAGLPGLEMSFFVGFAAPKATPGTVVARLNREMVASLRTPEVAKRIESLGVTLVGDTPDQFNALIAAELKRYRDVVAAAGAVAE